MFIAEYIIIGALSAIGWWTSNHYIIEPYFPEPIVKESKKVENNKQDDVK